ncbi:MAG: V-type ATP synthase subunit I [Sedimentisphaerales bacterium]|nr:V-type ATP synthase subunit I [Sedimentisphaerales bacterium]
MAIVQMAKVMIVCHRSQASDLLEMLQQKGICQVLNAQEAMVSKEFPELADATRKPRDIELMLARLEKAVAFLKRYAAPAKGLAAALAPRAVVDEPAYNRVVGDEGVLGVVDQCEQLEASIEKARSEIESQQTILEMLHPWESLESPVEEIGHLSQATCRTGLVPAQHLQEAEEKLAAAGAAMQRVGLAGSKAACLVAYLNEGVDEVQKALRGVEFEAVTFEGMRGTVVDLVGEHREHLDRARKHLQEQTAEAARLSESLLKLEILYDHYRNLLSRETARDAAPATAQTVIFEGWVKKHDYDKLEAVVSRFSAAGVTKIEPGEGEEVPVEIENKKLVRPFEVVTRLYGMPQYVNVDPTALLMPFFAIFFGMCIADAGYGLLMIGLLALFIKKIQGDKKLLVMLAICGVATVLVGALTGGWFGDAIQKFIPALKPLRNGMMWFDPFANPLMFFGIAIGLGYFQLIVGLVIAFVHNLRCKDYIAAVCDQLTWIVMLNSIVLFGASKAGVVPAGLGRVFGILAIIPAVAIFLFSHREGGIGARLGMGFYNVFSTVFYLGDVLSYLRLMALGMVGAGLAMAINVIAEIAGNIPVIGFVLTILILVGGHVFNLLLAMLSAFVHTLRLQYVEFFPKFLVGGGRQFEPLTKEYKHIYMRTSQ